MTIQSSYPTVIAKALPLYYIVRPWGYVVYCLEGNNVFTSTVVNPTHHSRVVGIANPSAEATNFNGFVADKKSGATQTGEYSE